MKKNLFKKIVTMAVTAAMAVCAMIAVPTKAEAASVKDIYLVTDTPAEYSMGFWTGSSGIMLDAQMSVDGWTYIFTEVEEGLYKMSISLGDNYTALGMSIAVDGTETYKADPNWSGSAGAEVWVSFLDLLEASDEVYIGLDDSNKTITVLENPNEEPEETEKETEKETEEKKDDVVVETQEQTTKDYLSTAADGSVNDTDDGMDILFIIIPVVVVIIVVAIVVVNVAVSSKKKSAYDFDDEE